MADPLLHEFLVLPDAKPSETLPPIDHGRELSVYVIATEIIRNRNKRIL
jgi:hypothetical protein